MFGLFLYLDDFGGRKGKTWRDRAMGERSLFRRTSSSLRIIFYDRRPQKLHEMKRGGAHVDSAFLPLFRVYDIRRNLVATRFVLQTNSFTVRLVSCICRSSSQKIFLKERFFASYLGRWIWLPHRLALPKKFMLSYVLKWQRCLYLWLSVRILPFGVVSAVLIGCEIQKPRRAHILRLQSIVGYTSSSNSKARLWFACRFTAVWSSFDCS